jgi:hypothetical protein
VPLVGAGISLITLACIVIFRWRDTHARLKISYNVGEPEFPADLNDILPEDQPEKPALYIKVHVKGMRDVRLNNVFIRTGKEPISFDALGNFLPPSIKVPGDHWIFCQPLEELAITMRRHGYPPFEIVVRDGSGREHTKRVKIPDLRRWLPPGPAQQQAPS